MCVWHGQMLLSHYSLMFGLVSGKIVRAQHKELMRKCIDTQKMPYSHNKTKLSAKSQIEIWQQHLKTHLETISTSLLCKYADAHSIGTTVQLVFSLSEHHFPWIPLWWSACCVISCSQACQNQSQPTHQWLLPSLMSQPHLTCLGWW